MARGFPVNENQKTVITALSGEGQTITTTANTVDLCRRVVREVIMKAAKRGGGRRRSPKRKLLRRAENLLLHNFRTGALTAEQLRDRFAPMLTVRRVQQLLDSDFILRCGGHRLLQLSPLPSRWHADNGRAKWW